MLRNLNRWDPRKREQNGKVKIAALTFVGTSMPGGGDILYIAHSRDILRSFCLSPVDRVDVLEPSVIFTPLIWYSFHDFPARLRGLCLWMYSLLVWLVSSYIRCLGLFPSAITLLSLPRVFRTETPLPTPPPPKCCRNIAACAVRGIGRTYRDWASLKRRSE